MRYIPHTEQDIRSMLETIGLPTVDSLFASIPTELQLHRDLAVPSAMAEPDLKRHLVKLANKNVAMAQAKASFLGGGVYRHYVPVAVSQLLLRGEIYTAYTPYQPEIAQGTLQIIFEFQTMVAELTGCDVVNASMYDGSTALAEAALMALRVMRDKPQRVILSRALHPEWREVTRLFLENLGATAIDAPVGKDGRTDLAAVEPLLADGATALCVGYPTFFGTFDDLQAARALCDKHGSLLIASFQEALAFGLVEPPGQIADIVVGEGQSLGVSASLGGPHLGLFGTREKFVRQMPGRLAGETVDSRNNRGFVLTMSTREQHIRREKATSNICTNVALMATSATIAMTLTGKEGLAQVSRASHLRAEETRTAVLAVPGFSMYFEDSPTYNEFVVRTPVPADELVARLAKDQIAPGISLARFKAELRDEGLTHALLITATELTTPEEIAALVEGLGNL